MNFSDPPPPPSPYQFISPTFAGGDGFWPPNLTGNVEPDLLSEYGLPPPKRPRNSKKPRNLSPFPIPPVNPRVNSPNIPGSKGTGHIFYKTRICARFMEGTCRNGEHCTFAHGPNDLREPPPNWQELVGEKNKGNGNGGGWGDDQRRIQKTKICKKYYYGEECPYGEKCIYLHERPHFTPPNFNDDVPRHRESSAISIGTTWEAMDSSNYFEQSHSIKQLAGGLDNKSRMAFWKTKLCSKWEMGQCPSGEKCHYARGQSELKSSGTRLEAESATRSGIFPTKPLSASVFNPALANVVIGAVQNNDGEDQKKSKWKSTKKINRIYADWLDDRTPPYCSPIKEEI